MLHVEKSPRPDIPYVLSPRPMSWRLLVIWIWFRTLTQHASHMPLIILYDLHNISALPCIILSPHMCLMNIFKDLSMISQNIRGAVEKSTLRHVDHLVKKFHPPLCLLYETHAPFVRVAGKWDSWGYKPSFIQEVVRHSGGIWVLSSRSG